MQARGNDESQYYPNQYATPSTAHQQSSSSVGSSPRADSFGNSSVANQSYGSNTTYTSPVDGSKISTGLPTPAAEHSSYDSHSHPYAPTGYQYTQGYNSMNQTQSYMDVNHAPASAPQSSISQYSYGQPQALQPAAQPYPPNGYGYS